MAKQPTTGGADIQLEHGHVRIVNAVVEAMALAPFNGGQLKVLIAIIRATWGWQRKDAEISTAELADATGVARSTAAAALRELVEEGVVLEIRAPSFRSSGTYRPQKDPTRWGRYAVQPPALSEESESPESRSLRNHPPESPDPRTPVSGTSESPAPETVGAQRNPRPLKTSLKDKKDIHPPSSPRGAPSTEQEEAASAAIRVANRGMADNPAIGSAMTPIPTSHGSRSEVLAWLQEGISKEAIERAVYDTAATYQPAPPRHRQISTMKYFTGPVHDEWDRIQAVNTEAPNGATNGRRVGGRRGGQVPQRFDYAADASTEDVDLEDPEEVQRRNAG